MKIKELTIFGYATRGAALEVANHCIGDMCVAEIRIVRDSFNPASNGVAWIVLREKVHEMMTEPEKHK